jgi:plasmid stability protein
MSVPTNEILLALRSPNSGWLAAVICALDEAMLDHDFTAHHRDLLRNLLGAEQVPTAVSVAAQDRLQKFEEAVQTLHDALVSEDEVLENLASGRPHLRLCASAA